MVNTKRFALLICLSLLFILFQTPLGLAQESSSSSDESPFLSESDVTYTEVTNEAAAPPPEEVTVIYHNMVIFFAELLVERFGDVFGVLPN